MSTTIAKILTRVNSRLQTAFTTDQLRPLLQEVLDEMSEADLLVSSDATQSLVANDKTLDFPTGYRASISIVLTDSDTNVVGDPLVKLKGGHEQYRQLASDDVSNGIPSHYSRFNEKFHLWRTSNANYDALIEFYKNHDILNGDEDDGNDVIEFGDIFTTTINAGATYKMAAEKGRTRMINQWFPLYQKALNERSGAFYRQPRIVRANT